MKRITGILTIGLFTLASAGVFASEQAKNEQVLTTAKGTVATPSPSPAPNLKESASSTKKDGVSSKSEKASAPL